MATLFEINEQITSLIDAETGEILDFDAFDALTMQRNEKIENVALWVKNLTADVAAYKREKEMFAEREKAAQKQAERLKSYLSFALDGAKFQTERCEVNFKKSKKVEITDESALPPEYLRTISKTEPNKTAITQAIKAGQTVSGAELVENLNISIK